MTFSDPNQHRRLNGPILVVDLFGAHRCNLVRTRRERVALLLVVRSSTRAWLHIALSTTYDYATVASPFFSTSDSSLSEAPEGRFTPRAQLPYPTPARSLHA